MKNEFYFRVLKVTKESEKENFIDLYSELQKFKKIAEFKNFEGDFFEYNKLKISDGIEKYSRVYHRKFPETFVQNFVIKCSINSSEFYTKNKADSFAANLNRTLNKYFTVLYLICVPNSIVGYEYYAFCVPTVKAVFQAHSLDNLKATYREPKDVIGVLSFNLILGGSIKENPLGNFYLKLLSELNSINKNYQLCKGNKTFLEEQYRQESFKLQYNINNMEQDIYYLLSKLQGKYPDILVDASDLIESNKLGYLEFMKN